MDMHISNLSRCKTTVWNRPEASRAYQEPVVATQHRYCRGHHKARIGHTTWSKQGTSSWLGESRSCEGAVEEGREVHKSYYQDEWAEDCGVFFKSNILCLEKQLLEAICHQIQLLKPENIPKPPYNLGSLPIPAPLSQKYTEIPPTSASASTPLKGTQKDKAASSKSKSTASSHSQPSHKASRQSTTAKHCLPIPPEHCPLLSSRLSAYSPVLSSGILIDTVKAGMNAQADASPGVGSASGGMGGIGKGKRKLVRVRQ